MAGPIFNCPMVNAFLKKKYPITVFFHSMQHPVPASGYPEEQHMSQIVKLPHTFGLQSLDRTWTLPLNS